MFLLLAKNSAGLFVTTRAGSFPSVDLDFLTLGFCEAEVGAFFGPPAIFGFATGADVILSDKRTVVFVLDTGAATKDDPHGQTTHGVRRFFMRCCGSALSTGHNSFLW